MDKPKSVLVVVTSNDRISDEHTTGVWFEEFAIPYRLFREAGLAVTVASTKGGQAPVDRRSLPQAPTDEPSRAALNALADTVPLADVDLGRFDALFFPGGHGTMYDLPENPYVTRAVERFLVDDKVIGAVCHGPAAFIGPTRRDGLPVVQGRRMAAFTNAEEREVGLDRLMPFLLETRLKDLGARVETAPNWAAQVVVDGRLVTGQNPQSSADAAQAVIELLLGGQ